MSDKPISFKQSVLIPAGQSLILGIFLGTFAFILSKPRSPIPDVWGMGTGLIIASSTYALFSILSYSDFPKLQPKTTRVFDDEVRVKLIDDTTPYKKGTYILLSIPRNKLIVLANDLKTGKSFSLSSFGGKGKLFSRSQFETLRDEFILRGLAIWKNETAHSQGLELTRGGRAFARYYASEFIIPPPPKDYSQFKISPPLRHRHMQTHKEQ